MRVVIAYNSDEEGARRTLAELPGEGHGSVQANVADPDAVRNMVESAIRHLGRLDVLVNNAGIYEYQPFYMDSYEEWQASWRRTLDTNLMSAANAAWCALPHFRRQGTGRIINVASRAAFRGETEAPAYAASKAGMVLLTRCIGRALAAESIYGFAIAPGWVETAMAREGMETMRDEIVGQIPFGRIASVDDVAGVAVFLASDAANYLTGITIDVNGASYLH
jgi:NAD(P)-dependent dehydrogenase (short-subunit alcohol dehydrogenase family)